MKEAYVSFEVAKLLKEKGFDWECARYYNAQHDEARIVGDTFICNWNDESLMERLMMSGAYSIPTQQMACRWLRERGIHIMPTIGCDVDRTPRIFYGAVIALFNDYGDIDYRDPLDENGYNEPEDAIEAALQYCLTNLI